MLWIIQGTKSNQIIGCNIHEVREDGSYQLWVERPTGKTLKVAEGTEEEVLEIKSAIDFAISEGITSLELE